MSQKISQNLKILLIALVIGIGVSYAKAWSGPQDVPPNRNTDAPINVGTDEQTKEGAVRLTGLRAELGSWIGWDNSTDLSTKPAAWKSMTFVVNGKIGADQYCDSTGTKCSSVSGFPAPDYDSGWLHYNQGELKTLTHNLGTEDTIVYMEGRDVNAGFQGDRGINQRGYGYDVDGTHGFFWRNKTASTIQVRRNSDPDSGEIRIRMWKIGS